MKEKKRKERKKCIFNFFLFLFNLKPQLNCKQNANGQSSRNPNKHV